MFFFILLVAVDQLTKLVATKFGLVSLNFGLVFGLGSGFTTGVWVALVALLIFLLGKFKFPRSVAILLLAGVASNLLDRFLTGGGVRDWLPILGTGLVNNFADWYIAWSILIYGVKCIYGNRNFV